jgi:hypothetical protein
MSLRRGATIDAALLFIGVATPAVLFVFIMRNALNLPIGDEWSWVLLLYKVHTSGLQFSDLWAQHNEHRIVFPTLLMLALDRFGGYDVVRENAVSVVLAMLTLAALVALIRRTITGPAAAVCFAFASLFVFSMTQWENWICGFQMGWFLVNLCAVIVIVILSAFPESPWSPAAAAVVAFVGSFSVSSGLNVWIAGAFVMVCIAPRKPWRIAIWVGLAILCFALYLHGYEKPTYHPSTTALFGDLGGFVQYVLTYLGTPLALARTPLGVQPAGILVVVSFVVLCAVTLRPSVAKSARDAAVPWLALAIFAGLAALMTGIGRFGFGIDQAFAGRYVTVSAMFWIGTFGALCALVAHGGVRVEQSRTRFTLGLLAVLLVGSYTIANVDALHAMRVEKDRRLAAFTGLLDLSVADNLSLSYAFPDPNAVRDWGRLLEQIHEGPFR